MWTKLQMNEFYNILELTEFSDIFVITEKLIVFIKNHRDDLSRYSNHLTPAILCTLCFSSITDI